MAEFALDRGARALDGGPLLDTWETAVRLPRPWSELAVLAEASAQPVQELARLPLGRRDAMLLELHERFFGAALDCETACPACGERLELTVDAGELLARARQRDEPGAAQRTVRIDRWEIDVRAPDSTDVAAALESDEPDAVLLDRCMVGRRLDGEAVAASAGVPQVVLDAVDAALASLDPDAELDLALDCPACGATWDEPLDPASFVLDAIEVRALRLLAEVDALARSYGWREPDVLALTPERRRRYLELALG